MVRKATQKDEAFQALRIEVNMIKADTENRNASRAVQTKATDISYNEDSPPVQAKKQSIEENFDPAFATALALREKQIQQNYRPVIGIHKWFARRPGTIFRSLLLAEYNCAEPLEQSYWHAHQLTGTIADPFMGGGTPLLEANRLGFSVVGADTNPMAYWIVRQALGNFDRQAFNTAVEEIRERVGEEIGEFYQTTCTKCGRLAKVKYFLWVKTEKCPSCETVNDLFPGYLLASDSRHTHHVIACSVCGFLNEYEQEPSDQAPEACLECNEPVLRKGPAHRTRVSCRVCRSDYKYPAENRGSPPAHRMWAIEYHCFQCKTDKRKKGRFFKKPDQADLARYQNAKDILENIEGLPIPEEEIPPGDETNRLRRWGYTHYKEMFNDRQLLGLGLLMQRILLIGNHNARHALLTVFSDLLRYQNMLCRYDTDALKCQDIFSVHGFPVGQIQCENNLLGIPNVGAGSLWNFAAKYIRAMDYCESPFETSFDGKKKKVVQIEGEKIAGILTNRFPTEKGEAYLIASPAGQVPLPANSLDGVFTDPPYFGNVQYAELIDFNYVWLRIGLGQELAEFTPTTTRSPNELTANATLGKGMEHFTEGLSQIFRHYGDALKPGAPFVFTYHHNDLKAYVPLVVAILDAGLNCTATLPAAAEMSASLHISNTGSSVLDSIFVCRREGDTPTSRESIPAALDGDRQLMTRGGVKISDGDIRCLIAGHITRATINELFDSWDLNIPLSERIERAQETLLDIQREVSLT